MSAVDVLAVMAARQLVLDEALRDAVRKARADVGTWDAADAARIAAIENFDNRAAVAKLMELLGNATGYVEAISEGTAQHIDPLAAEHLAEAMNAALARCKGAGA